MRGMPLSQLSSRSSSVSRLFWLRASSFFSAYSLHTRSLSINSLSQGWMYLQVVVVVVCVCVGGGGTRQARRQMNHIHQCIINTCTPSLLYCTPAASTQPDPTRATATHCPQR